MGETRRTDTGSLLAATRAVLDFSDLAQASQRVFDLAREALGALGGHICFRGPTGDLQRLCTHGEPGPHPCLVLDSPRLEQGALCCPIRRDTRTAGTLVLTGKPGGFTPEDLPLAEAFAQLLALALARHHDRAALTATLEATADGILTTSRLDPEPRFNQRLLDLWGLPSRDAFTDDADALERFALPKLVDPDAFAPRLQEILAHPEAASVDLLELKDGRLLERRSSPQRMDEQIVGRVWSFRDVTDRVRAERALQEREAQFRALVEHSPDLVVRFDRSLRIVYLSPSVERLYGQPLDQFLDHPLADTPTPPSVASRWKAAVEGVFASGRDFGFEFSVPGARPLVFDAELVAETEAGGEVRTVLAICRDVTAQRQTEQDYRTLFSEMLDGFALHELICDDAGRPVDYRFLAANPAFTRLTDLREPVGRTARELLPTLEPLWLDAYARVALTGRPERFEGHVDALARHFEVSAYSPRPGQFAVFFQDVTARKASEQALQESEARYRALFETSHTAMLLIEPTSGAFLDANSAACALYGYPREQMQTLRAPELEVGRAEADILADLGQALTEPRRFEVRNRVASGAVRTLDVHCGPIAIHGLPMLYAILHDVTEAREAEASARRLYAAIEQTSDFVAITDAHKVIEYVNPALETLAGYTRGEAVGRPLTFLHASLGPDGSSREQAHAVLAVAGRWVGPLRLVRKDRGTVDVEASLAALRDGSGRVTGYVAVHRDVTEQRQLEKQLRQSQKMEALGTLAGGIAHDFNNILAAILGFATLAQNSLEEGHPAHQDLGEVLTASQRARDLVRQILAFSRRTEMRRSPLQVSVLAKEALKLLRATIPSTIEFRSEFAARDDYVLGDPTQLHQIVMNLCTNAAHAMRERGGVLAVTSEVVEVTPAQAAALSLPSGPYVRLRVQDTGHGMDAPMIDRAFDPYFTTKPAGEGTGLGLPVVHGIVMQAGGAVSVSSEPGRGTVVDVYLPRHAETAPRVVVVPPAAPRGAGRILFVDDEPALVRFGKQCLEGLGYEVVAVTSPTDALDLFEDDPESFDLVISDQTMPLLTGVALAREVHELRPQTPILLCTGYSESIPPDGGRSAGVRQVLLKPLPPNELALAVAEALKPPVAAV